jgi:hypothetical protein
MSGEASTHQPLLRLTIMDSPDWDWIDDSTIVLNADQANECFVTNTHIVFNEEIVERAGSLMSNYIYARDNSNAI